MSIPEVRWSGVCSIPTSMQSTSLKELYVPSISTDHPEAADTFAEEYSRKRLPIQSLTSPARISYLPTALKSPTERESMDNLEAERQVTSMKCSSSADKEKAAHVDAMEGRVEVRIVEAWLYVWLDDIDKLDPNIWR